MIGIILTIIIGFKNIIRIKRKGDKKKNKKYKDLIIIFLKKIINDLNIYVVLLLILNICFNFSISLLFLIENSTNAKNKSILFLKNLTFELILLYPLYNILFRSFL
jgi:hypothetical protein